MPVEFRRTALRHRYLDPRRGFAPTEVEAEVREDPLTGETCRVILLKGFRVARPPDADARVASLRATLTSCPFCPGVLENRTPRFEPDLFPEGRLRRAEAVAFPNLMPFDAYACVVVLSADHFVTPSQLGPARIRDGLVLAVTFLRRVLERRGDQVGGGFVGWNYLPESGGSIVHPHLQALAGPVASTRLRTLEVALRRHAEREGSDYWSDLLAAERADGARYLGRTGAVEWVVAFAPRAMAEVVGVLEHCTWVGDLGEAELADVAAGLDRVLRYYERMAVHGFNVSLYPGLRPSPHFRVHVRVVARHYAGTLGVNDMNYLQVLQDEAWTLRRPEDVAAELKGFFGAGGVTGDGEEGGGGACSTS